MTKKEFYLRSIIAMAANPNYVSVSICPPDENLDDETTSRILNKEEILEDAADLLKETEEAWNGVFDEETDETTNEILSQIRASLEDLSSALTTKCEDDLYPLHSIADELSWIRRALNKIRDNTE